MAADLKKNWFNSVIAPSLTNLTRLLYNTPSIFSGRDRLNLKLSSIKSKEIEEKFYEQLVELLPESTLESAGNLTALDIAILMYKKDPSRERMNIFEALIMVNFSFI
jgi:hypothetical protein